MLSRVLDAHERAQAGELGPLAELAQRALGGEWELPLRTLVSAHAWLAGLSTRPPAVAPLGSGEDETRWARALALPLVAHGAFLRFDGAALEDAASACEVVAADLGDARQLAWSRVVRAFAELMLRGPEAHEGPGAADLEEARSLGDAPLVIEVETLRAAYALAREEAEEAVALARRASRMSRTESLPQSEYLANLVLARVRRVMGRHHHAAHVLSTLRACAPAPWHEAIDWELCFCGFTPDVAPPGSVLEVIVGGDRRRGWQRLFWPHRREYARLSVSQVLDAAPDEGDEALTEWLVGERDRAPGGVDALIASDDPTPHFGDATAVVVARPGRPSRRVLITGLDSAELAPAMEGLRARGTQERLDRAMAIAMLAPDATIAIETFFRRVYGFEYVRSRHQSVLDSLVYRLRQRHDTEATIERSADDLRLRVHQTFVVPDPRTAVPVSERILRLLGSGARSARQAAKDLGVPLRTLHAELKALVDDGSCRQEKKGRAVVYHVEDTTFAEPTRGAHDLSALDLD